jgi:hypothetical protein
MEARGAVVSAPQYVAAAAIDGTSETAPIALVTVAPFVGGPETVVRLMTPEADADYFKEMRDELQSAPEGQTIENFKAQLPYKFIQFNR